MAIKEEQENVLKKLLLHLSQVGSEEALLSFIQQTLPALCQVDLVILSHTPWTGAKYTSTYRFTHNDQEHCVHFHKAKAFLREERLFLKKVGKALKWSLIFWQKEKQLEIEKAQWEMAFDAISIPISLTDKENRILRTNKVFRESINKPKLELLGKNSFEVFFGKPIAPPPHKKKTQAKAIIRGEEKTFEIAREKLQGLTNAGMYLLVLRDISKNIKMEREIALSAKSDEIDIISHSIAHELNNPVAGIQALLQTLQPKLKAQEPVREMEKAIKRCGHMVHELLKVDSPKK